MTNNEKVIQCVMEAIDELNEQLPKEEHLKKSPDAALTGSEGNLDSLRLVSLITTVEQIIEDKFGVAITLLDDVSSFEIDNPFSTVDSLAKYVSSLLEKHKIE